jgi:hypothetical protein
MAMTRWVGLLGLCLVLLSAWAQDPPRVQPGDSLRITVEGDESLSRVYVVDSTGGVPHATDWLGAGRGGAPRTKSLRRLRDACARATSTATPK